MKTLWLFRSNLQIIEYYHDYKDIDTFKKNCHDFYLLQGIWYLENTDFEEFVVLRLLPKEDQNYEDIIMDVNGKKFKQLFLKSFDECISLEKPIVAFFRGGFPEYDDLLIKYPDYFKDTITLYLGASKRVTPKFGGKYNKILVEDEKELNIPNSIPFYKTVNPEIFNSVEKDKLYDIVWICNNTQIRMKGQEYLVKKVSKSSYLKSLKILHVGNKPEVLENLLQKYNVNNILSVGYKTRTEVNDLLNSAKISLITSNKIDGCPRLITEALATLNILICRNETRMLDYYRYMCVGFDDNKLESTCKYVFVNYNKLLETKNKLLKNILMDEICKKNLSLWFS